MLQGALTFPDLELQRFLMPRLQGVLRAMISKWKALELQSQRDEFTVAVKDSLNETFSKMGLAMVDFEVIEISFPPEFKEAIAQAALSQHSAQALPPAAESQVVEKSPESHSPADTAADLNRQIDALTERLAEGKISEETFNKLVARLEEKLRKLSG